MAPFRIISPEFLNESCIFSKSGLYIVPAFTVVWSFLFFPLCFVVLHVGFQRWRQNRGPAVSHTDFFTYNTLVFNLLNYCGFVMYSVATLQSNSVLTMFATAILVLAAPGLQLHHVLTCVERYLAVVHPVDYLSLKKQKWIWARSVIVFGIWMFCLACCALVLVLKSFLPLVIILSASALIISFCSVQVLRALRNPSPGEGCRVGPSKQKAFFTILAIMLVLALWLTGGIVSNVFENADELCKLQKSMCWFELPSSLVMPLLFLHRAKKLPKCRGKKAKDSSLELRV